MFSFDNISQLNNNNFGSIIYSRSEGNGLVYPQNTLNKWFCDECFSTEEKQEVHVFSAPVEYSEIYDSRNRLIIKQSKRLWMAMNAIVTLKRGEQVQ